MQVEGLPPLPSVFSPLRLREAGDAMARAIALAPTRGAGTLCWVGSAQRAEAAVVLEPDRPLGLARIAFLTGCNALADAVCAIAPPELPVRWRWPGTLTVNDGVVGEMRMALPPDAAEGEIPAWLVLGFELRLRWPASVIPGERPGETSFFEEGFDELDPAIVTELFARHLMANMDEWEARGLRRVSDKYLARLEDGQGTKRGIDPATGALVLEQDGQRETRALP
ncbi:biotin/lipoate--protein ligase family protein [Sabulicella glaciei]|uniref:Biotin/lipoate--protein ligase family protein n=1 Tax=Sabulicella glaciei TaxID=2984948 RepID=A0ABT3P0R8_9PROT|nr:biotin/lipoate--protein ligase family protein [Roseococcus sp. MDT2-1-1]MCW8087965.1 biotin/lipoate--protein ligase family protein [Roseococcus sp. MDT2-1-1]